LLLAWFNPACARPPAAARSKTFDDPELLIDLLAGVLVYRYFLTTPELRAVLSDQVRATDH